MEVARGLSDDLIANILERLPKESLLRSRCVSKRWRGLIDDHFLDVRFFRKLLLYLFPMLSSSINCINLRRPDGLVEIENPLGWESMVLLGSCRGFLCIYNEYDGRVAIWSPSIGSCQLVPPAEVEIAHRLGPPACVYGFGYDNRNEEYVLLRLVQTLEDPMLSAVSIYRSRARVWRRLPQGRLPYSLVDHPDQRTMGVFLRGHLHWIMRRHVMQNSAKVLVAFDIHTEGCWEVHQRQLTLIDDRVSTHLAVLKGRLCLIIYDEREGVSVSIASEYRSEEWHRLFSIANYTMGQRLLQPLAYSQNGPQVLLLDNGTLVSYDLQTEYVESFHVERFHINNIEAATCFFIESHLKRSGIWLFGEDPPRLYGVNSLMDVAEIEDPPWEGQVRLLGSGPYVLCISKVDDGQVALWNPTTRSRTLLPPAPADADIPYGLGLDIPRIRDPYHCVYGFGYDRGEYVLLRLVQSVEEPIISTVSIYRSRANAWRWLLQKVPYYLADSKTMGVFTHGRLHWIMRRELPRNSARVLVAFDFRTESFEVVVLPDLNLRNNFRLDLAFLGVHLCLIFYGDKVVDVWIMEDSGLISRSNRWDLLFSLRDHWGSFRPVQPLTYFRRRVLFAVGSETRRYNLDTNEVEQIHINGMPSSFVAVRFLITSSL